LPFCFSQVLPPVQFARVIMTQPPWDGAAVGGDSCKGERPFAPTSNNTKT